MSGTFSVSTQITSVKEGTVLFANVSGAGTNDIITYQWQRSLDGTFNDAQNVGTTDNNANGYYQLTEADEGYTFRVIATDTTTPQTATSTQTAAVADITPVITPSFSIGLDEFKIIRDGSTFYDDNFATNGGVAPPDNSNPNVAGGAFSTGGSTWSDNGTQAIMSSTGAAIGSTGTRAHVVATLDTNTQDQSASNNGLKLDHAFTVDVSLDLVTASKGVHYGLELDDLSGVQDTGVPSRVWLEMRVA